MSRRGVPACGGRRKGWLIRTAGRATIHRTSPRAMKCPACFNELTELHVGNLAVDVCQGGCGGIWFDAFELQQVDDESETAGEPLLHIERDERLVVDASRKRECPRCVGIKLQRHFFSAKRRVEVDQCPNCAGYWLDAGELAMIRAERSQNPAVAKAARATLSAEVIRYIYRLRSEKRVP
jgi:Zn-finger nucleic acid-binding protein